MRVYRVADVDEGASRGWILVNLSGLRPNPGPAGFVVIFIHQVTSGEAEYPVEYRSMDWATSTTATTGLGAKAHPAENHYTHWDKQQPCTRLWKDPPNQELSHR